MKGRNIPYSASELAWLEANHAMVISDYHRAFRAKFGRPDVAANHLHCLRRRRKWRTGRTGHFAKGSVPANKGKPCEPGKSGRHPNSRRTQFKKGNLPQTYRGAGHERIDNKYGYVVLIVEETNPWTGAKTRPVLKHRYFWEQVNGPLPAGHVLKCLDGDKTNCSPSNWEAIPRSCLPFLNGRYGMAYDEAAPEIRPAILALAKLRHAACQAKAARARGDA